MKSKRRSLLIVASCLAITYPAKVQVEIGSGLGLTLKESQAIAEPGGNGNGNNGNEGKGNNGGGKGNNGSQGNPGNSQESPGNSGNAGNSGSAEGKGNSGNAGDRGNSGNAAGNGDKGNNSSGEKGGTNGANGGSNSSANGHGASNADSGQGRSSGQGNPSSAGGAPGQGNSASQGGQGRSSNQGIGNSPDKGRGPQSAQPPGLSAVLGTITNSLRPVVTAPVSIIERTIAPKSNSKAKSAHSVQSKEDPPRQAAQQGKSSARDKIAAGTSAKAPVSTFSPPPPIQTKSASADPTPVKPTQAARSIVETGLSSDGLARLTRRGFQAQMRTTGSLASVVRLLPPRGMSLAQAQRAVRLTDAGAAADFDHFYYTDGGSNCIGATCEAASLIGWNLPTAPQCGPVPTIGLIDTGIDREHEALQGQSIEIVSGLQLNGTPSQRDHGTAIAALLVGRNRSNTQGLLPEARLLAVDAFYRDNGTADRTDVTTLVMALEALAERNVRVVNMSLSGPPNEVLKRAIASAQAKGMVIVAAAGNNGAGAGPSYPAAYPGVIAVTAVDRNLDVYRRATQGDYIDLAAPGVEIQVAAPGGGYATKSGTSYAVPFISAAAAVLRASDRTLDLAALQAALESHTLDLGQPGRDRTYGYGLLQAKNLCPPQQNELPVAQSGIGPDAPTP
jgi:hypothetical protein